MKIYAPSYYGKFKCIADKCKHSCCVGWEIDIDDESLERYKRIEGEFGELVRKNISFDADCPRFITDDSEKCPFLNSCGLCDMIIELGKDALCEICAAHPRYRNFFSDRVEIGLGLCCEAVAEIVLSERDKVVYTEQDESDDFEEEFDEDEIEFFAERDRILEIIQDRSMPVFERIDKVQEMLGFSFLNASAETVARYFVPLEYMNEDFGCRLFKVFMLNNVTDVKEEWEIPLEQLAVYFIMRHTADGLYGGDIPERVAFCALCVEAVYRVCVDRMKEEGLPFFDALCDTARLFSSEIEYSADNTEALIADISELNK